jgi:hypothetical protein
MPAWLIVVLVLLFLAGVFLQKETPVSALLDAQSGEQQGRKADELATGILAECRQQASAGGRCEDMARGEVYEVSVE